jgi:hypothetical protein
MDIKVSFTSAILYQFYFGLCLLMLKVIYGFIPLGTYGVICLVFGLLSRMLVCS